MKKLSKKTKIVLLIVVLAAALALLGGAEAASKYMADNPEACGKCHLMQPYVQSYFGSEHLDNVHAGNKPATKCERCHKQNLLQKGGELISFLSGTKSVTGKGVATQPACLSCHDTASIIESVQEQPDFAAAPQNSYHLNSDNAKACRDMRAELVQCQDCHKSHDAPVDYCSTCHPRPYVTPGK